MGIPRVYSVLKLDERRDREQTLEDKVDSVQRLLHSRRNVNRGWVPRAVDVRLAGESGRGESNPHFRLGKPAS